MFIRYQCLDGNNKSMIQYMERMDALQTRVDVINSA
jgi:hypothetical protein